MCCPELMISFARDVVFLKPATVTIKCYVPRYGLFITVHFQMFFTEASVTKSKVDMSGLQQSAGVVQYL
jgi:hypothetical protein